MVDLVDIGLMNASEALGRRRLNDTMRQLSDAISAGILVDIETTSGLDRVAVTSLRRCDSDVTGCSNASVVAKRNTLRTKQRPRAVTSSNDTSSNDAMTSATCRTVMELIFLCCLSLYLNRLRFTDSAKILRAADSRIERI